MVREVEARENRLRFHDRLTEKQFDECVYSEYHFRSVELEKQRTDNMLFASFTAWQMLASQGMEKTWQEYKKMLGLSDEVDMGKAAEKNRIKRALAVAERIRSRRAVNNA